MTATEPKDAAAIILLKDDQVLLAQRNPNLKFLGGWHAFSGGKLENSDAEIIVKNCEDIELQRFIVCAVRELFEEIGVLIVRNGEKLTKGQRASLHDDLISGRSTFGEILAHWNLWIDAADLNYTGFWTTPNFSPVRFKTRFFMAECPPKQTPYEAISEMQNIEFIAPSEALNRWEQGEILISPPVLISLQELAKADARNHSLVVEKLLEKSQTCEGIINYVELNSRLTVFPLQTQTLPPATHTNCFIIGTKEFIVVDAASADGNEQAKLHEFIDSLMKNGGVCRGIIVSHLHPDHFGGETALQTHLQTKFNASVPVAAHKLTAESLAGKVEFQKFIADGEVFNLRDANGEVITLQTLHTPGHARGHLNFYLESVGFLISCDNVVGLGSVVIAPPEGNMSDYFQTLERLKNLPNLRFLCGSHGAAIFDAKSKINEYIAHRLERESQVLQAFNNGAKTPREIVEKIYIGLPENLIRLAEKSVAAHLEKLKVEEKS